MLEPSHNQLLVSWTGKKIMKSKMASSHVQISVLKFNYKNLVINFVFLRGSLDF